MKRVLLFLVLGLFLISCKEEPKRKEKKPNPKARRFFNLIFAPNDINVHAINSNNYFRFRDKVNAKRTILLVSLKGLIYGFRGDVDDPKEFAKLADAIGDYPSVANYNPSFKIDITTSSALSGCKIVAQSDYNDKYPAGSDISKICTILIMDHNEADKYRHNLHMFKGADSFKSIRYPYFGSGYKPQSLLYIIFDEAPSTAKQKLEISLGFTPELKKSFDVKIKDLEDI